MAEGWLLLMTECKLLGMKVGGSTELVEEEQVPEDWEFIPPPPFDFAIDLPVIDFRDRPQFNQHHFVYDSKLYVARGGLIRAYDIERFVGRASSGKEKKISDCSIDDIREYNVDLPCCKIYQFDHDMRQLRNDHSIPPLPTPFAPCFLGNIIPSSSSSGDVYCLVYHKSRTRQLEGLWVLRSSGQCEWERLSSPPPFDNEYFQGTYHRCFVSQEKLSLGVYNYRGGPALYSFDPRTAEWMPVDSRIMRSFDVMSTFHFGLTTLCFPSATMSLPGLTGCSVGLHCDSFLDEYDGLRVKIHALMLNNQNGAVSLWQSLDECFEGLPIGDFEIETSHINLADLGNGKFCALLYGFAPDHDDPFLCVSVFSLTVAADFVEDIGAEEEEEEDPQKKQAKFLNVQVHVKRPFSMKYWEYLTFLCPFVFTPDKEER